MATTSRMTRTRLTWAAATLLAGAATVVGVGLGLAAPAEAASQTVVIKQYAYSPANLTIGHGDTVTWTNQDSVEHDVKVTQGPATFRSPLLGKGQSWSHTFTTAGSYAYICSVHPDMKASITVRPMSAAAPKATTHPEQHASAAAPTSLAPGLTASTHTARSGRDKAAKPAATDAASPAEAQQLVGALDQPGATLDPLLIVAGVSTAVMVFCLLLMTSRPVQSSAAVSESSGEGPSDAAQSPSGEKD
jgi:plastocyanin